MKRLLSLILCAIMLCTVIVPIKSVEETEKTTLYSGGSGTEDDPYLISTAADVEAIYNYYSSIESREVGAPQLHFKLTKDLTIKKPISILSYDLWKIDYSYYRGFGYNTYVASSYVFEDFASGSSDPEKNINTLLEKYGKVYVGFGGAWWFSDFEMRSSRRIYLSVENEQEFEKAVNIYQKTSSGMYGDLDFGNGVIWAKSETETVSWHYYLYFDASFTGVFDGNGHTIFFEPTGELLEKSAFLFGAIDNGAVVKNLNVVGNGVSLAYELKEGGIVENCTIDSGEKYMMAAYWQYYSKTEPGYDQYYYDTRYVEEGGNAIAYNYGTVRNCYNRSSLAGKLSNDDDVNAKDVNIMKRAIVGVEAVPDMICSDMNMDGHLNAKDMSFMMHILVGNDPRF